LSESVEIVEKKPVPSEATMIIGLPDGGLVGLIATSYLITELKLEEIKSNNRLKPQFARFFTIPTALLASSASPKNSL
jgi:proteasome assembly chaperone (PAC2) family protein